MNKMLRIVCLLVLLLNVTALGETLTVLHLNDTHAHLLAYGPKDAGGNATWGGMARVASLVGMNKMTEPNVMLLHSGDLFVGDFMFQKYLGIPELEIMKQLGYDAVELGNHEFDLYPSTLKYVLDQAGFPANGFPVLCANLDYSADPEMGYFVKPYIIKQYGAVKVGIFGLLTDFTNSGSNVAPDNVIAPLTVAQAWIDSLRIGHGCDVVILLSHLGVDMDQMVAATTHGIDVIVGGHTHTQLNQPLQVGSTLILQAGEFAHYLGKLHLNVTGGVITSWDYQLIPVEAPVPEEPTLSAMLAGLAAGVEADPRFGPVYTQTVARAAFDLDKNFGHGICMDNPMGNMIADAFRNATSTDIAIQPQGFINQPMFAGPVVGNDVFQAVPYGFDQTSGLGLKLATFQTDGASLIAGLEFSVYNLPYLEDFFLHASNLSFAYNSSNPPGARVDYASIVANGKPLDPSKTYTVTVPDGVVPFLSQIPGFNMVNLSITDKFMYTVVRDYMTARTPVKYYREGRIVDLAVLADPLAGTRALSDMVAIYKADGAIKKAVTADRLQRGLAGVTRSLERGRTIAALLQLCVIRLELTIDVRCGTISNQAAATLKYLIAQLMESIKHNAGIAWKEGDELADAPLPESYELLQNYPNPFNPTTQIEFALPMTSEVTITIYNTLGQQVQTLVNETMPAGLHVVEWNGTDAGGRQVASGVYFYRISAGDYTATKKMVLMK
jgi:5'-nucleotidase / UDP-sugar diphosphatase